MHACTCRRSLTCCGDCSVTPISRAIAANGSVGASGVEYSTVRSFSLPARVRVTHSAAGSAAPR
eukprot:scaffold42954_cov74-Phaeocystis_antarctica.AAC.2